MVIASLKCIKVFSVYMTCVDQNFCDVLGFYGGYMIILCSKIEKILKSSCSLLDALEKGAVWTPGHPVNGSQLKGFLEHFHFRSPCLRGT